MSAEVVIDNKDIGFVNARQVVAIKLEPFRFTRHSTVAAEVKNVTAGAVTDEGGAILPALLEPNQTTIDVDGNGKSGTLSSTYWCPEGRGSESEEGI